MGIDWGLFGSVKGFLDAEEAGRLYELAREALRIGPLLEIGSYCGKSALCLGAACRETGGVLFSVDHHRGSEEQQPGEAYFDPELYDPAQGRVDTLPHFRRTLRRAGLAEAVVPLVCESRVAARGWRTPLGLVFIDGGHAFETVLTDYTLWAGHVLSGGFLLMHDIYENPEEGGEAPFRVYRRAIASGRFDELPRCRSLGILVRR